MSKFEVMAENGRPQLFTEDLALKFLTKVATTSFSIRTICADEGMPSVTTVYKWLNENESFAKQYARAKEDQADYLIEEMIDIADDGKNDWMTVGREGAEYEVENKEVTNRSKLRVDTRKWIASKLKPKKYGDKLDVTSDGEKLPAATTTILTGIADKINQNADDANAG